MTKEPKKAIRGDVTAALSGIGAAKETLTAPTRGRPDRPYVSQTFFIPRATHGRLKALAAARQTSVQMLLAEAVDAWLASQGEPPFFPEGWEGWKPKARGYSIGDKVRFRDGSQFAISQKWGGKVFTVIDECSPPGYGRQALDIQFEDGVVYRGADANDIEPAGNPQN